MFLSTRVLSWVERYGVYHIAWSSITPGLIKRYITTSQIDINIYMIGNQLIPVCDMHANDSYVKVKVNPYRPGAGLHRLNQVNSMITYDLAPDIARSLAVMILTMRNGCVIVLVESEFQ